jgi:hypothetical protein
MVRWDRDFVVDDPPPGARTCDDGEHLPFIVGVAAQLAMAAQRFLATGRARGAAVSPDGVLAL